MFFFFWIQNINHVHVHELIHDVIRPVIKVFVFGITID